MQIQDTRRASINKRGLHVFQRYQFTSKVQKEIYFSFEEPPTRSVNKIESYRTKQHRGRNCASRALTLLPGAHTKFSVAENSADTLPVWPDEICGSIAHSDSCSVAAVARKSSVLLNIGVDIEPAHRTVSGSIEDCDTNKLFTHCAQEASFKAVSSSVIHNLNFLDFNIFLSSTGIFVSEFSGKEKVVPTVGYIRFSQKYVLAVAIPDRHSYAWLHPLFQSGTQGQTIP